MLFCAAVFAASACLTAVKPDPPPPPEGIRISVSLNQSATDSSGLAPVLRELVDADGTVRTAWAVRVSDWADRAIGPDAANLFYDFIDRDEKSLLECLGSGSERELPAYEDLRHAFFVDGSGSGRGLCVHWDMRKAPCLYRGRMDGGSVATRPDWTRIEKKTCSYVMERRGGTPAHLGETVWVEGVATVGCRAMACNRFIKFHVQDGTGGVYVFADTLARKADQGYDGSTFDDLRVYPGDRVAIQGTIRQHNGMIELHPISGGSVAVLARGEPLPSARAFGSVDEVYGSAEDCAGDLVRVNGVRLHGSDAAAAWPGFGQETDAVEVSGAGDTRTLRLQISPGSGIPGSGPPAGPFDLIGVLQRQVDERGEISCILFPRTLSDIRPLAGDARVSGPEIRVVKAGHAEDAVAVPLERVPQCLYETGATSGAGQGRAAGPEPVPIATLDAFIVPQAARSPQDWLYEIVGRDGGRLCEPLRFTQLKSGFLYMSEGKPNARFHAGAGLPAHSLEDVAEIVLYRQDGGGRNSAGPAHAAHGEGVRLFVQEEEHAVSLRDLPVPGADRMAPLRAFVPDSVMSAQTQSGFFTTDQIRALYDYRLISYDGGQECTVSWEAVQSAKVDLSRGTPSVAGLDGCTIPDLFTIEMMRKLVVDDGVRERTLYWSDLPARTIDVGGGKMEKVVFFDDVLDATGMEQADKKRHDYRLLATDDFGVHFPYGHGHLKEMYFNPSTNKGFVTNENPDMPGFGGCFSTKAVVKIVFRPIPERPPSLYTEGLGWLSDPASVEACDGCHFKDGKAKIVVSCAECHP
ncbi:MAG: hypothetical protein AB1640_16945 [bacterium]